MSGQPNFVSLIGTLAKGGHQRDTTSVVLNSTHQKGNLPYNIFYRSSSNMASRRITILLTSFSGLGLPATLSHPISASSPISDLSSQLISRLPLTRSRFIITTTSNRAIKPTSQELVSSLLSSDHDSFLTLRLTVPLCGGKGGFGSQLRAAGGRMSSKRKKHQGENNGSNRNLDGRRLRTVTEAKALAEYLALKPEMEKKEKDARRKRWEQIIELAERREAEIKNGSQGRVDGKWVEDMEEAGERTREAVLSAIKSGDFTDNLVSPSLRRSDMVPGSDSDASRDDNKAELSSSVTTSISGPIDMELPTRTYFGFDDDDKFTSEDEDEDEDEGSGDEDLRQEKWSSTENEGKGKA